MTLHASLPCTILSHSTSKPLLSTKCFISLYIFLYRPIQHKLSHLISHIHQSVTIVGHSTSKTLLSNINLLVSKHFHIYLFIIKFSYASTLFSDIIFIKLSLLSATPLLRHSFSTWTLCIYFSHKPNYIQVVFASLIVIFRHNFHYFIHPKKSYQSWIQHL